MGLITALCALQDIYPKIREIETPVAFTALLGTLIDQWVADHDLELEDGIKIVESLLSVMPGVHESEGQMSKTIDEE